MNDLFYVDISRDGRWVVAGTHIGTGHTVKVWLRITEAPGQPFDASAQVVEATPVATGPRPTPKVVALLGQMSDQVTTEKTGPTRHRGAAFSGYIRPVSI
jgi:hypothetical protein